MILNLLFPKICFHCGSLGKYICLDCQKKLCWQTNFHIPLASLSVKKHYVDDYYGFLKYDQVTRSIMKNIKYRLVYDAFTELNAILASQISPTLSLFKSTFSNGVIQPIPLHPNRERSRGFNQSKIIAQFLASQVHVSLVDVLRRCKETVPQAQTKSRQDRLMNLHKAFEMKPSSQPPSTVVLVDDVVTTGATVNEAAYVLKENGVKRVYAIALAQG